MTDLYEEMFGEVDRWDIERDDDGFDDEEVDDTDLLDYDEDNPFEEDE